MPTFQKWKGEVCQGIQLHTLNKVKARPWLVGQMLCRELYHCLGENFEWNTRPYEYQFNGLAIDYINGNDSIRKWVESRGPLDELIMLETKDHHEYKKKVRLSNFTDAGFSTVGLQKIIGFFLTNIAVFKIKAINPT